MVEPLVDTCNGKLRGARVDGVCRFLGIPYGAPPVGRLRFKPAKPVKPWAGIRDALTFGSNCPQGVVDVDPEIVRLAGTQDPTVVADEAGCLVLNVWSPRVADGGKRPVMVWLHGGGYMIGSATPALYDGARLAARGDVAIVTLNHRLNAFGHLYLAEFGEAEFADSGNIALLDIVTALRWVRDNIAQFGGDPNNVTLFGVSGGGAKVAMLMALLSAKDLFHKAIIQSGGGFWPKSPDHATETASAIVKELGLSDGNIEQIYDVPADRIVQATAKVLGPLLAGGSTRGNMGPVLDGRSLSQHPFIPNAPVLSARVPLIIGTNKHEATLVLSANLALFSLSEDAMRKSVATLLGGDSTATERVIGTYRAADPSASPSDIFMLLASDRMFRMNAIALADSRVREQHAQTYMYLFSWETPVWKGRLRAAHALEIPFVFDNIERMPMTGTDPGRQALADQVSDAWLTFARFGNPSHPGIPLWNPYDAKDRRTLVFDKVTNEQCDPGKQMRTALQELPLFVF